jgi:hypothetical protein
MQSAQWFDGQRPDCADESNSVDSFAASSRADAETDSNVSIWGMSLFLSFLRSSLRSSFIRLRALPGQ